MRTVIPFNDQWLFAPEVLSDDVPNEAFHPVTLPHSNVLLPHHNFDQSEYEFISTYRKCFRLPEPLNGRRVLLDFDGAMIAATVSINGHTFDEHRGGYVPFSFDITDYLDETGENLLTVYLDSRERKDIPPFGYVVDYLTFGGIYRDVRLRLVEPVYIADVFVQSFDVLNSPKVVIDVWVNNLTAQAQKVAVVGGMEYWKAETTTGTIPPGSTVKLRLHSDLSAVPRGSLQLWSLDNPQRYNFTVSLYDQAGLHSADERQYDEISLLYGFREARFASDGFYLNGEKIKLRGLNRHQTFPFIGAAAPARLQARDADILKYELGCNIVRTSHYPQSPHFLQRCDEIGLLVFEEIPGWQFIGDDDWKALALRDLRVMIERDRNHPSIILWGVRINESWDDGAFYEDSNTLAKELDPTRQAGGVRNFKESVFLEDVYTYNDFSNTIDPPVHTPHLVTEFNGHMFPTKSWDNEDRQLEHALRHARIQNTAAGMDDVTGAIGWCAFDYHTHHELGSGDRVCYHGVMDMFRLPKFAAYFYASQQSPRQRVVLQAATFWTMGDRSEGGNDPLVIFSNCDEIAVYVGGSLHGRFQPDREHYPHLPHPPFAVTGLGLLMTWGSAFEDLRVVGYLNGQEAAEQRFSADGLPAALVLEADDAQIQANGADMTRIIVRIADRFGNRLPYTQSCVTFSVEGPADLIGENPFALMGGNAAVYLKARYQHGIVVVRAQAPRLPHAAVSVKLI